MKKEHFFRGSVHCLRKSDVALLKINIFERFKNIDIQRSYGHFSETGEYFLFVTDCMACKGVRGPPVLLV